MESLKRKIQHAFGFSSQESQCVTVCLREKVILIVDFDCEEMNRKESEDL